MGETKDNLKPSPTNKKGGEFFEGVKNLIRPKKEDNPKTAKTYVDLMTELEQRNSDLIIAKRRDVENDSDRYEYHRTVLTELEIQQTLINQIIESTARAANAADKDSGKH